MITKRIITPHKGGRTARLPWQRATPRTRQMYDEIMEATGESGADLYERLIKQEHERLNSSVKKVIH